jgi:hypothetical protein
MKPTQLKATDFESYPPQARQIASANLELFRQLPLVFAAVLLREVIAYDWRFPAEQRQIDGQLNLLGRLPSTELAQRMAGFNALRLNAELESSGWVKNPSGFVEQLTAWFWTTHQLDGFRQTADLYASYLSNAMPDAGPALPRLGIVVVGQGAEKAQMPLFRKLRPNGVYLTSVKPEGGLEALLSAATKRAERDSEAYAHWYIDGGTPLPAAPLTQISYAGLERPRTLLLERTQQAIQSGSMGPEGLRSLLAQMKPEEVGLQNQPETAVLNHFQLTLLTEGSGAQIFATTFAQWAARECLRRAQPETLVVRYAPRQQLQPMNEMLSGAKAAAPDPQGSLVDADMGAYYTWINMTRLPGADRLRFLVWFEGHREAVAIGPGLPRGTTSNSAMDMRQVLELLA